MIELPLLPESIRAGAKSPVLGPSPKFPNVSPKLLSILPAILLWRFPSAPRGVRSPCGVMKPSSVELWCAPGSFGYKALTDYHHLHHYNYQLFLLPLLLDSTEIKQ